MTHTILGAITSNSSGYRLLLLVHLLCVIVGFGSTFVWPLLGNEAGKRGGPGGLALSEVSMKYAPFLSTYVIYGAGASGLALAIASDQMDKMFIQAGLGIFLVAVLFSALVHVPNLKKMDALAHELAGGQAPGPGGPPPQ
jgi:hypothetical protein